jgi:hypothetical protein
MTQEVVPDCKNVLASSSLRIIQAGLLNGFPTMNPVPGKRELQPQHIPHPCHCSGGAGVRMLP